MVEEEVVDQEEAVDQVKIETLTALQQQQQSPPTTRVLPFSTVFRRDRQVLIDQGSVS